MSSFADLAALQAASGGAGTEKQAKGFFLSYNQKACT